MRDEKLKIVLLVKSMWINKFRNEINQSCGAKTCTWINFKEKNDWNDENNTKNKI